MEKQPHQPTLRFIHRITSDGIMEKGEIWDLAAFLNEDREARHDWPGSVLWETLNNVFDDGEVSPEEMAALGSILRDIENECGTIFADKDEFDDTTDFQIKPADPKAAPSIQPYHFPKISRTPTVQDSGAGELTLDLSTQSCNCADWQEHRRAFEIGEPGRRCAHLAHAFAESLKNQESVPAHTRALLEDLDHRGGGGEPDFTWQLLEFHNDRSLPGHGGAIWCQLYAPSRAGEYERFSYHRGEKRWFFGAKRRHSGRLKKFMNNHLSRPPDRVPRNRSLLQMRPSSMS
ncbi:MAG: hypothetical protein ACI91J_000051 [Yoonia sp.]|jgi:hypothetical protein